MPTKPTILYCHEAEKHGGGKWYAHFHSHPWVVSLYRDKTEKWPILEFEVSEGPETPDTYWAWWDEQNQAFEFVYPDKSLVNMCFPYGYKIEQEQGKGKLVPVQLKFLRAVPESEFSRV